ncbi:MAG: Initiation factor 2B related protein [Candidatus Syntrophoarchaeum caldarius]|uniref:Putative methylthioribose-1-phosphate isomerase n=1 Tax=Candidatus Syntropharchaeum caldarium TaxID=1838285 RepID=A0A1F2PCF5_9EURY|nr:MAG: Initiation factor 2B related protein [Candidatus Syntrophoarchaeum caldarius]
MQTIAWDDQKEAVTLIDQRMLPDTPDLLLCNTVDELIHAIRTLAVRGAPAIGVAAAFGVVLSFKTSTTIEEALKKCEELKNARPTAVNLQWAVERVLAAVEDCESVGEARERSLDLAKRMAEEDVEVNRAIGKHGAKLFKDGERVLTHCNAGRLACVDWGTALGVIRSCFEEGKHVEVVACETRPLNQGSRITAWELMEDKIPVTLITDSSAAYLMQRGMIDKVIVGADRIVKDAVFNKIGTYSHAVNAKHHGIPFYVAAPMSTFDLNHTEADIKVEERDGDELRYFKGIKNAPDGVDVLNFAFDATPLELVSAIVTEEGVIYPPF